MFAKMKQLLSDSFAFALVTLGNKLVSLLMLPVYTTYLSTAKFGDWDVTNTLTMLITYICILGTDAALAYYYFDAKTEEDRRSYLSVAVFYSVGVSIFFLFVFTLLSGPISFSLYDGQADYGILIILASISTVEAIFIQQMLAFARFSRRVWTFNIMSLFYWVGSSLLNILFLVFYQQGVVGIFIGQVLGGALTSLLLLLIFWKNFTFKFKWEHLHDLLRYGAPLVPSLLSFWIMSSLSRPLIYHIVSPSDAGVYGAAVRVATFITLITSAFQLAWRPFVMSIKDQANAPVIFSMVARFLLLLGTIAIMMLTFFIKPIMILITADSDPAYIVAYPIVWMLSTGTLLNTLYVVVSAGLLVTKKTAAISQVFMVATVIYLVGNIVLIPLYSFWGTAIMTLLTYVFIVYYVYFKGQKAYPIPFKIKSITAYLLIYLALMVGITYVQVSGLSHQWLYYGLAWIGVLVSVFATKLFSYRSLFRLKNMLRPLFQRKQENI
jgi:O-antigen/teichoic acid export membrane protein